MSKEERADIVEALNNLPDDAKQFVLGYAAGVSATTKPAEDPQPTPVPAEPEFQSMEFYWLSGADRYPYGSGVPSFNRK